MREESENWAKLWLELASYSRSGVGLFLENKESSPAEIADACMVCDDYMRDYVMDQEGVVEEIRFDRVLPEIR